MLNSYHAIRLMITITIFININALAEYDNCDDVETLYDNVKTRPVGQGKFFQDNNALATRYKLEKQFTSGRGGANVFWVKDRNENDKDKVIKIFKAENFKQPFNSNHELREIYLSCELEKIDNQVFPIFYGFGYTNSDDPWRKKSDNNNYFFFVMEFIKGKDLLADSEQGGPIISDYDQIKKVLIQVATGLQKAHAAMGFFHTDLQPGNIMLIAPSKYAGDFKAKIIDFGWATSSKFYKVEGINAEKARNLTLVPEHLYRINNLNFLKNLVGTLAAIKAVPQAIIDSKKIAENFPHGDDVQSLNMIIYALKKQFDPPKFYLNPDEYCRSYVDCIKKLQ